MRSVRIKWAMLGCGWGEKEGPGRWQHRFARKVSHLSGWHWREASHRLPAPVPSSSVHRNYLKKANASCMIFAAARLQCVLALTEGRGEESGDGLSGHWLLFPSALEHSVLHGRRVTADEVLCGWCVVTPATMLGPQLLQLWELSLHALPWDFPSMGRYKMQMHLKTSWRKPSAALASQRFGNCANQPPFSRTESWRWSTGENGRLIGVLVLPISAFPAHG